jgi:hypothetical protein
MLGIWFVPSQFRMCSFHRFPSPPKRPHQFCLRKDMTFHGPVDILAVDWGTQV